MSNMEELLTNAFSTGDIKIIIVAVILYIVISVQRGNTKKDRDGTAEEFDKRVTLLENEVKRVKDLDLETKLAQIQTDLQWIKENLKK